MANRFKGIRFKSWDQPLPEPKKKLQWVAHNGNRAKLRYLRQRCKSILDSTDPDIVMTGQRIGQVVRFEKDPERAALMIIHTALLDSARLGKTWVDSANAIMDNYEQHVEELSARIAAEQAARRPDGETSVNVETDAPGSGPLRGEAASGTQIVVEDPPREGEAREASSGDEGAGPDPR